jgi:murein DD-endopeptidase MepM/ murein hydrolase activator NlpD
MRNDTNFSISYTDYMKFKMSLIAGVGMVLAACAQRPEPAPVTGWNASSDAGTILVRPGDTVLGIARHYGVPPQSIIAANRLVPPYRLLVGQTLLLPGADATGPIAAAAPRSVPARVAQPQPPQAPTITAEAGPLADPPRIDSPEVPPSEHPATRFGVTAANQSPPVHAAAAAIVPPREPPPAARSGAHGFVWPVRGRIIEAYGSGSNGTQNDGINIAARAGAPVYAAAAGEVVYVGNELRGYGNLVLIKHEGGYLTAYAHNATLMVRKGDRVARGQVIALVGATGQVREPQLHFEIRYGRDPVDPMQYLPPEQQASIRN